MDNLLLAAPDNALPDINSRAYELLSTISDGEKHIRVQLCNEFGGGFRSYLQQLMGEYNKHWLIHSEPTESNGKEQSKYWLYERHFSLDWEKDKGAQTIAKKKYKVRLYYSSRNAVKRLKQVKQEKAEADKKYQHRIESKKPTEG